MKKHLLAFLTIASVFLCLCSNSANACYEIFDNQPLKQSNPHSFIRMVKFLFTTLLLADQIHAFPVTRKPTVNPIRLSTPPEQENSNTATSQDEWRAFQDDTNTISNYLQYGYRKNSFKLVAINPPTEAVLKLFDTFKIKLKEIPPEDVDDIPPTDDEIESLVDSLVAQNADHHVFLRQEEKEYLSKVFFAAGKKYLQERDSGLNF